MSTKTLIALSAALALGVLASGSVAMADEENDGGNETGGYVLPGSRDGVNPAYHPRWFPAYGSVMRAYARANRNIYSGAGAYAFAPLATGAYAFAPRALQHKHHRAR